MADNNQTVEPEARATDRKLEHLIKAVVEHQKDERKQLMDHWITLKENPSKKIIVDTFNLSNCGSHVDFNITCESAADLAIWKHCINDAIKFLYIPDTVLKSKRESLHIEMMKSDDFEWVLFYLEPLALRTHWKDGNIEEQESRDKFSHIIGANSQRFNESQTNEKMEWLIESVAERMREEGTEILNYWVNLRSNKDERMIMTRFDINEDEEEDDLDDAYFTAHFHNAPIDMAMWKHCLATAIHTLNLQHCLKQQPGKICVVLNDEGARKLFNFLQPLAQKLMIFRIYIYADAHSRHVRWASKFFNNAILKNVTFRNSWRSSEAEIEARLHFIRKTNPLIVEFHQSGEHPKRGIRVKESDILLSLAELVNAIIINEPDDASTPISIIKEMLRKKCDYIRIDNGEIIRHREVERIVQYVSHVCKKVAIQFAADEETMESVQIGEYNVDIDYYHGEGRLLIEHMDINPKFDHIFD